MSLIIHVFSIIPYRFEDLGEICISPADLLLYVNNQMSKSYNPARGFFIGKFGQLFSVAASLAFPLYPAAIQADTVAIIPTILGNTPSATAIWTAKTILILLCGKTILLPYGSPPTLASLRKLPTTLLLLLRVNMSGTVSWQRTFFRSARKSKFPRFSGTKFLQSKIT